MTTGADIKKETEGDVCACTVPMTEWVKEQSKSCRPCLLGPVVQWYTEELQDKGHKPLADGLMKAVDENDTDAVPVCQKMDEIKENVGVELKARLREFDCEIQNYAKQQEETGSE